MAVGLLTAAFVVQTHYLLTTAAALPGDFAASLDGFAAPPSRRGCVLSSGRTHRDRRAAGRPPAWSPRSAYNVADPASTFCPHCEFHKDATCDRRVAALVERYHMNESEAEDVALKERCRFPPPVWLPTYSEEDEPAVILHVGPHKVSQELNLSYV